MNMHWFIERPKTRTSLIVTRIVQLVVVIALIAAGTMVFNRLNDANAEPVSRDTTAHPRMPAPDPDAWVHTAARKFRRHHLDNSQSRIVPTVAIRKLRHYKRHHPKIRPWWKKGLDYGQCMFNAAGTPLAIPWESLCLVYGENPTWRKINNKITEVKVLCGASAVVGSLRGGGMWGAVAASGLCSFTEAYNLYRDWLGRRVHTVSRPVLKR